MLNNIKEIDTTSNEGKALFGAVCMITCSPGIMWKGETVRGDMLHPDEALQMVKEVAIMCSEDYKIDNNLKSETNFRNELTKLINKYSLENDSDTPDFILANYIVGQLQVFNDIVEQREKWYGREAKEVFNPPSKPNED